MANQTLRDLVAAKNSKSAPIISHLEKAAGIVKTANAELANDGIKHVYQKYISLPSLTAGTLTDGSTPTTVKKELTEVNLSIMRTHLSEPADLLDKYPGGPRAYFNSQVPVYNEAFLQSASKATIYGNNSTFGSTSYPQGFHQVAKAN